MNYSKDNLIIKILGKIINKMNYIINENKKNIDMIRKNISSLLKKFDELKINNTINNQELQHENGKYIGPVINGLAEGRGIWYGTKDHLPVIDMKVNLEIIKKKEKEFIIILMEIEKWVIILMINP